MNPCNISEDCFPKKVGNVPDDLIHCDSSSGLCVCSSCFELFNDTCRLKKCQQFQENPLKCIDNRKSQKIVLLLSAFLSSIGAANFYIGQYTLGRLKFIFQTQFGEVHKT